MNRTLFSITAIFGALMPLVFDSAMKGAVLLAVAALVALTLWRASAAARHLVWLVAIVALLIVPVLSLALPQWRVLPAWGGGEIAMPADNRPSTPYEPYMAYTAHAPLEEGTPPEEDAPTQAATAARPALPTLAVQPTPTPTPQPAPTWREWMPLAWCVGFTLLAVRLLAAHLLLRRASRQCPALTAPPDEKIAAAFADACTRLGIRQRVTLLLDKKRTIPVVWGVFRPRLMLPLEAREWSDEQLRSVLLHELGHIKRRDTLVQWLTQIACALHWWNPLVWLAAWRLHTERERACDDLVLASGVRPSAYAEHLLDVATKLSPARWTSACGLAMARKSSLENRLLAVLSEKLDRRSVTRALATVALILGACIAVPVAMLRAADEKAADEKPKTRIPMASNIYVMDPAAFPEGVRLYSAWNSENGKTELVILARGKADLKVASDRSPTLWTDAGVFTLGNGETVEFERSHKTPAVVSISGKNYDLGKGRVFVLNPQQQILQCALFPGAIEGGDKARELVKEATATLIAAAPKNEYARNLFQQWQKYARANGDIPGGLIAMLGRSILVDDDPKFPDLQRRCDGSHDWTAQDAADLLDAVAGTDNWLNDDGRLAGVENLDITTNGKPLPPELAALPWGDADDNFNGSKSNTGLRAAFTLDPAAASYAQGTALPVTVHFHNSGTAPLVFPLGPRFMDMAEARDKHGRKIFIQPTRGSLDSGLLSDGPAAPRYSAQLAPGHWISFTGARLTLAAGQFADSPDSFGNVMFARAGSTVRLRWMATAATWRDVCAKKPLEWKERVAQSFERVSPTPKSRADRERIIRRMTSALTGGDASEADVAAFVADESPDALAKLIARIQSLPPPPRFVGWLKTGEQTFTVTPGPADYRGTVMTATGTGAHEVDESVILSLREDGGYFEFLPPQAPPNPPLQFSIARDAQNTAIPHGLVWRHGSRVVWVAEKARVRKLDLTVPGKLTKTDLPAGIASIPEELRAELVKAFPGISAAAPPKRADASPANGAGDSRRLDWSKFPHYEAPEIPFANPFVPADALRLAAVPEKSKEDVRRLVDMIHQATAEKAVELRPLLADEKLAATASEDGSIGFALAAYDYSVNGNKAALQRLLDAMAFADKRKAETAAWSLAYLDEWELTNTAFNEHFGRFAIAEEYELFWAIRKFVYPEKHASFFKTPPPRFREYLELHNKQKGQQEVMQTRDTGHGGIATDAPKKLGFPKDELVGGGVVWNDAQNSLSLGYRIIGDEWRIHGKEVKVELWVQNSGDKDVKFQLTMRPDIGLRVKLKNETSVKGAKEFESEASIVPSDVPPFGELRLLPPGHALKVKEFAVALLWRGNDVSGIKSPYFLIEPGAYKFHCELELPGFTAFGEGGKQLTPAAGEWTGKLTTRDLNVVVIAPDAPAPKPRVEHVSVRIGKDGEVSLDRKKMSLDELKTRAARNAKKWFTIEADEEVPYAKVVEVVEALKAAGVTEFSFAEARVGDGKYRVANLTANYDFDGKHHFSICRPSERPQWFTVSWPAEGERPACALRTFPNVSEQTRGKWAVVWEPGTDVLWWVDDTDVGKMTLTDPAHVIVDREGRRNNFSRDFALPKGVVTEFRRLGFVIGRDKTPGLETAIGGNTGGQSIVSAEAGNWMVEGTVTDADGKPMKDVPVRVTTNQELKTEKTDEKGNYRAYFSLPIQLLAKWRAVTVEPVLEGFTERDMAKAGEFNVLLRPGEEPQRVRIADDAKFEPGPIPRFAERDLIPSQPGVSPGNPGRADFVMLKAGEITGEIVTANGKPAPPHFIGAATPEQRPGHNAAIEKSDAQGRFRLKGIPTNKPVILTVNPDGKPGETSKSSEQKFEQSREHRIRITLPADRSGKGPVNIERLAIADIRHDSMKPPEQARQWNDKYSAVAYQTEKGVNFVLIHEGFISTGLSESYSETIGNWIIEGNIHLVDAAKTKAAGQNVDKRKVALKYTSDGPGTLSLDGRDYDLKSGRVFILRDEGEPEQLEKTMPLRDKSDLEKLGGLIKKTRSPATPSGASSGALWDSLRKRQMKVAVSKGIPAVEPRFLNEQGTELDRTLRKLLEQRHPIQVLRRDSPQHAHLIANAKTEYSRAVKDFNQAQKSHADGLMPQSEFALAHEAFVQAQMDYPFIIGRVEDEPSSVKAK